MHISLKCRHFIVEPPTVVWWESTSYYVTTSRLGYMRVSGNGMIWSSMTCAFDIHIIFDDYCDDLLTMCLPLSLSLCYATTHVQPRLQKQRHHEESAIIFASCVFLFFFVFGNIFYMIEIFRVIKSFPLCNSLVFFFSLFLPFSLDMCLIHTRINSEETHCDLHSSKKSLNYSIFKWIQM